MLSIGIDQSYTNTGLAAVRDGKIIKAYSVAREKDETRVEYRMRLLEEIYRLVRHCDEDLESTKIYTENNNTNQRTAILASAELRATIENFCFNRSMGFETITATQWQSALGRKKYKVSDFANEREPKKMPVIKIIEEDHGVDCKIYSENGKIKLDKDNRIWYDSDMADAIGIALYGWRDINV
jgi:hypothetical protein